MSTSRAVGEAKDPTWYDTHVRDLFTVQSRKAHFLEAAADDLDSFIAANHDLLSKLKIDPALPLRDAINPVTELRAMVAEFGVNTGEINMLLHMARTPSPVMSAVEHSTKALIKDNGGDPVALLKRLGEMMRQIECVDRDAYGGAPKP